MLQSPGSISVRFPHGIGYLHNHVGVEHEQDRVSFANSGARHGDMDAGMFSGERTPGTTTKCGFPARPAMKLPVAVGTKVLNQFLKELFMKPGVMKSARRLPGNRLCSMAGSLPRQRMPAPRRGPVDYSEPCRAIVPDVEEMSRRLRLMDSSGCQSLPAGYAGAETPLDHAERSCRK